MVILDSKPWVKLGPAQQSTYSPTSHLCCFCLKAIFEKSSCISIPQFAPSHYCPHYLEDSLDDSGASIIVAIHYCRSWTVISSAVVLALLAVAFSEWTAICYLHRSSEIGHNRFSHFDMDERPQVCVVLTSCGPMVPRLPSPQSVIDTYYAPEHGKISRTLSATAHHCGDRALRSQTTTRLSRHLFSYLALALAISF